MNISHYIHVRSLIITTWLIASLSSELHEKNQHWFTNVSTFIFQLLDCKCLQLVCISIFLLWCICHVCCISPTFTWTGKHASQTTLSKVFCGTQVNDGPPYTLPPLLLSCHCGKFTDCFEFSYSICADHLTYQPMWSHVKEISSVFSISEVIDWHSFVGVCWTWSLQYRSSLSGLYCCR